MDMSIQSNSSIPQAADRRASRLSALTLLLVCLGVLGLPVNNAVAVPIDLELVIGFDTSGSVDETDFALRRQGIEAAFRDETVIESITGGEFGGIAVTLWDFATDVNTAVDWFHITDAESSNAFADAVSEAERGDEGLMDGQSNALLQAAGAIGSSGFEASRSVFDFVSEGVQSRKGCYSISSYCQSTIDAGEAFLAAGGSAVNAIWLDDRHFFGVDSTDVINALEYGETSVLAGEDAFQVFARNNDDFIEAFRQHLHRVVASEPLPDVQPQPEIAVLDAVIESEPSASVSAPSVLLLMGLALLGLGISRSRV